MNIHHKNNLRNPCKEKLALLSLESNKNWNVLSDPLMEGDKNMLKG